jgi:hypothetical protein
MDVRLPDGTIIKGVPDGMTKSDLMTKLQSNGYDMSKLNPQQQANPTEQHSTLSDIGLGALSGASNIGATLLSPLDKLGLTGKTPEERRAQLEQFFKQNADTGSLAFKGGELGTEIAGTAGVGGAIAKPLGMVAPRLAQAVRTAGFDVGAPAETIAGKMGNAALRVGGGAATGAASSSLIDPNNAETGAVAGGAFGALSPVIGKAVSSAVRKFSTPTAAESGAALAGATDDAVKSVAADIGVHPSELPSDTVNFISQEAKKAFEQGNVTDAAALLRKRDFESLGINPLTAQLTRDPTAYANELNLRGVNSDIANRLNEQNRSLHEIFGNPAANASEAGIASNDLASALKRFQDKQKSSIGDLYSQARSSEGRAANVDVKGFSDAANSALDEQMLGRFLPEQARGLLNDISSGKIPLNVNNLVQVDSVLSQAQRGSDAAGQKAIGVVRDALNNAQIESTAGVEAKNAFDVARTAARENFKLQESIPALKNAIENNEVGSDFAKKFIINDKNANNVKRLAELLKNESPDAFNQAKSQLADDIKRSAFGENADIGGAISPDRLAKKLRELGTEKMSAFFTPEEIAKYQTASRVAAYIAKHPNAAPVNTSNTLVAQLMASPSGQIAGKAAEFIPLKGAAVGAAKAATSAVKNQMAAIAALKAEIPLSKLELSESQRKLLAKIMGGIGAAGSAELAN